MEIQNSQKKWARYMGIMSLVGLGMILLPFVADIDPMDGGGALLMVGLLLALTGLITYFIFKGRAKQMDDILNNRNIIARWKVSADEWEEFKNTDTAALKKGAFMTWLIIAFFFALFTAFFWLITEDSEEANFFVMLMGGIFLFISAAAWLATISRVSSRSKQLEGEVVIADNCLALNSEFHIWKGIGHRLEAVNYYQADKILEFTYSFPARVGRQFQEVRIPVPVKEKDQLQKVLKHFGIKPLEHLPEEEEYEDKFQEKFNSKTGDGDTEEGFEIKF